MQLTAFCMLVFSKVRVIRYQSSMLSDNCSGGLLPCQVRHVGSREMQMYEYNVGAACIKSCRILVLLGLTHAPTIHQYARLMFRTYGLQSIRYWVALNDRVSIATSGGRFKRRELFIKISVSIDLIVIVVSREATAIRYLSSVSPRILTE